MANPRPRPAKRRILAILLFPLMLILASCEMKAHMEFTNDDKVQVSMNMAMPKAQADMFGFTDCSVLEDEMLTGDTPDDVTVTDNSTDSEINCAIKSGKQPLSELEDDTFSVDHKDGKFVLKAQGDESFDPAMLQGIIADDAFSFKFTFPGKITDVSGPDKDAYTLSGNSVDFTSIGALASGFEVTAEDSESSSATSNTLLIVALVVGILILAGIVAAIVLSRRKKTGPAAAGQSADPYALPNDPYAAQQTPPADPYAAGAAPVDPNIAPMTPPDPNFGPTSPTEQAAGAPTDPVEGFTEPRADTDPYAAPDDGGAYPTDPEDPNRP